MLQYGHKALLSMWLSYEYKGGTVTYSFTKISNIYTVYHVLLKDDRNFFQEKMRKGILINIIQQICRSYIFVINHGYCLEITLFFINFEYKYGNNELTLYKISRLFKKTLYQVLQKQVLGKCQHDSTLSMLCTVPVSCFITSAAEVCKFSRNSRGKSYY